MPALHSKLRLRLCHCLLLFFALILCQAEIEANAQDQAAPEDIYNRGGSKGSESTVAPPSRSDQGGKSDTYGTGAARGSEREGPSPAERGGSVDIYGTGAPGGDGAGPTAPKKSQEGVSGIYGTGGSRSTEDKEAAPEKRTDGGELYGSSSQRKVAGEEVSIINRPPSIQGLTGLLITSSAFSEPVNRVSVGVSLTAESSKHPDYDVLQLPMTLTYGVTDAVELGLKAKYVQIDDRRGMLPLHNRGSGDTEVLAKWRFIGQQENFPAVAVGISGILPTGDKDKNLNEVVHWGAKLLVLASSEAPIFGEYLLGLYLEGQAVFIDEFIKSGTKTPGAERYGVINAGILFPFALENRLQAIVEYNQLLYKDSFMPTLLEGNYSALTPEIRFVTKDLSVTVGAQMIHKERAGYGNTVRYVGTVSYSF